MISEKDGLPILIIKKEIHINPHLLEGGISITLYTHYRPDNLSQLKNKYVGLGAFQEMGQTETVLIDLIISEQKALLEDIAAYLNRLKMLQEK